MLIDFRRQKTDIPCIKVEDGIVGRVTRFKLLGLLVDGNLKWKSKCLKAISSGKKLYGVLYMCN